MKKKNTLLLLLFILLGNSLAVYGQNVFTTVVSPLKNERWRGGVVTLGQQMPFFERGSISCCQKALSLFRANTERGIFLIATIQHLDRTDV